MAGGVQHLHGAPGHVCIRVVQSSHMLHVHGENEGALQRQNMPVMPRRAHHGMVWCGLVWYVSYHSLYAGYCGSVADSRVGHRL